MCSEKEKNEARRESCYQLGIQSLETGAINGDHMRRNRFLGKLNVTWKLARNTVSGPRQALLHFKRPCGSLARSHLRSNGLRQSHSSEGGGLLTLLCIFPATLRHEANQSCYVWLHRLCTAQRCLVQDGVDIWHLPFPRGASSKESTCQRRHGFNSWVRKILWRRKWQPVPVFLLGTFHGQRSLVGYSPWGPKELDVTEHIHSEKRCFFFFFTTIAELSAQGLWPPRRCIVLICTKALWLSSGPRDSTDPHRLLCSF